MFCINGLLAEKTDRFSIFLRDKNIKLFLQANNPVRKSPGICKKPFAVQLTHQYNMRFVIFINEGEVNEIFVMGREIVHVNMKSSVACFHYVHKVGVMISDHKSNSCIIRKIIPE